MLCPKCHNKETRVLDSREAGEQSEAVRRRRECEKCNFRFSTYEQIEILNAKVQKKSGEVETYNPKKIEQSLKMALKKGPYLEKIKLNSLLVQIEYKISQHLKNNTITSKEIGEIVLAKLKRIDPIAYLRFASVYRAFEDIREFRKEMRKFKT
jgi:transcriptional repressor NrdR